MGTEDGGHLTVILNRRKIPCPGEAERLAGESFPGSSIQWLQFEEERWVLEIDPVPVRRENLAASGFRITSDQIHEVARSCLETLLRRKLAPLSSHS